MKNLFLFLFVTSALGLGAQDPFDTYYKAEGLNGGVQVCLKDPQELLTLAQEKKITKAFLTQGVISQERNYGGVTMGPPPIKNTSALFVVDQGVVYWVDFKGFTSIPEWREGTKNGFLSGADYRDAKAQGTTQGKLYYYAKENEFQTPADAAEALKLGFVKENLGFELLFPNVEGCRDYMREKCRFLNNQGYDVQNLIKVSGENQKGRDAFAFYLAKFFGVTSVGELKETMAVLRLNYKNLKDYKEAQSQGFTNSGNFYGAKNLGYKNFQDYEDMIKFRNDRNFSQYLTAEEYGKYKVFNKEVKDLIPRAGNSRDLAEVLYILKRLPAGKPYSRSGLHSFLKTFIEEYPCYKINYYIQSNHDSILDPVILHDEFKKIGTWDPQSGVFIRK